MKKLSILAVLLVLTAAVAAAADVNGKWRGQVTGREGQTRDLTFNLKAESGTLTGDYVGPSGRQIAITDGKIAGDDISFAVTIDFGGNTMKFNYSGKVAGDEIRMKVQREGAPRVNEFILKRTS